MFDLMWDVEKKKTTSISRWYADAYVTPIYQNWEELKYIGNIWDMWINWESSIIYLQSLLKTADQLKIKGLCEVPESREGPPSVSLSSPPPRDSATTRLNYTKLKRHHPRYKRQRTTFEPRATSTDSRHYDKYKEEENNVEGLGRDNNKEVR